MKGCSTKKSAEKLQKYFWNNLAPIRIDTSGYVGSVKIKMTTSYFVQQKTVWQIMGML